MSSSTLPMTSSQATRARVAWVQQRVQQYVRPYHLVFGAVVGLITVVFGLLVAILLLISTNFNVLGWTE